MLRDITLGQYYPVQSPVHGLDPRTKILLTMAYLFAVFMVKNMLGYAVVALFLYGVVRLARLPVKLVARTVRPLRILLIFTFVLNVFFGAGAQVLVRLGPVAVYREGLENAVHFSLRLIFLVLGSSVMTLTTPPVMLTDGLERLASPLKKLGFPAHEMAMMMTIALRFIPTLIEEADKIMKAQTARGADFTEGGLKQRTKAMIPLLVPLFVSAFRRAGDLAMAMEARCYHGGEGRTRLHVLRFNRNDALAALLTLALILLLMLANRLL